jgi:hypothetical protein
VATTVSHRQQRMVQRRRLLVPDVEPGARHAARDERLDARPRLVVDATACGADEHREPGFMRANAAASIMPRVVASRGQCSDTKSDAIQHLVERSPVRRPAAGSRRCSRLGSTASTCRPKACASAATRRADVAQADQTDRLAGDLAAGQVLAREAALGAQAAVALGDAVRDRQDQSQRVLGHRHGIAARTG